MIPLAALCSECPSEFVLIIRCCSVSASEGRELNRKQLSRPTAHTVSNEETRHRTKHLSSQVFAREIGGCVSVSVLNNHEFPKCISSGRLSCFRLYYPDGANVASHHPGRPCVRTIRQLQRLKPTVCGLQRTLLEPAPLSLPTTIPLRHNRGGLVKKSRNCRMHFVFVLLVKSRQRRGGKYSRPFCPARGNQKNIRSVVRATVMPWPTPPPINHRCPFLRYRNSMRGGADHPTQFPEFPARRLFQPEPVARNHARVNS